MTKTMVKGFLTMLLTLGMASSWADAGKLIAAIGDVRMVRSGQELKLEKGAVLLSGDLIKVAADSSAQLRMSDQSIIALSPKTEFQVIEYQFSATKPAEGKAAFALLKGALRTVTGLIGQQTRENYSVKGGAVATVGIRGTHYRLRLCDDDCGSDGQQPSSNGLYGGVTEGLIGVTNDSGTTEFGVDEYFFVADAATAPELLPGPPSLLIDQAHYLAKAKRDGTAAAAVAPSLPNVVTTATLPALPTAGAQEYLSGLALQQFRPTDILASPDALAHFHDLPIVPPSDGFINIGGSGEIRGQIIWMTNADIDLHMLTPSGNHLYYENPTLSLGNATAALDHDNVGNVIDSAPDLRIENITVTGTQIPAGLYRFTAQNFNGNNNGLPTTVQIRVTGDGNATALTDTTTLRSGQSSGGYIVDYKQPGITPIYSTQP